MKRINIKNIAIALLVGVLAFSCSQQKESAQSTDEQSQQATLFPKGEKIESDHFTGEVWLKMIMSDDSTLYTAMGNVTFEPGARTNWHSHPGGQILMVTEGVGWYQERGKPKQEMRKGEVIICQPNIEHWHGASAEQSVTHMAMSINTQNGGVRWLEPVTDEVFYQNVEFSTILK